jgi:hypothetical protein
MGFVKSQVELRASNSIHICKRSRWGLLIITPCILMSEGVIEFWRELRDSKVNSGGPASYWPEFIIVLCYPFIVILYSKSLGIFFWPTWNSGIILRYHLLVYFIVTSGQKFSDVLLIVRFRHPMSGKRILANVPKDIAWSGGSSIEKVRMIRLRGGEMFHRPLGTCWVTSPMQFVCDL